jgi:hypothetical protein
MNKNVSEWLLVLSVVCSLVASFCAASQRDDLKSEAVKRGFAEWVVDDKGATSFKWKEGAK